MLKNCKKGVSSVIKGFPEAMRSQRRRKKMTVEQLADKIHTSTRTVYNYELGVACPPTLTFLRICSALQINPNDFI